MKIGFSQKIISPPKGIELAGYTVKPRRYNTGIHDDLYCKTIVFQNDEILYALLIFDLLCVDESFAKNISDKLSEFNIKPQNVICAAIHSHSSPSAVIPRIGELKELNDTDSNKSEEKLDWLNSVVDSSVYCVKTAISNLDDFEFRFTSTPLPQVGTDRHDGSTPKGKLNIIEFRTNVLKNLILYNFPCHPTVMNAKNLKVSADFIGQISPLLNREMSMFINGPAGDVSTRFTRKESSFEECKRMAKIVSDSIENAINKAEWQKPTSFSWKQKIVELQLREILNIDECQKDYDLKKEELEKAESNGIEKNELRLIKSLEEGALLNLKYSKLLQNSTLKTLHLPVSIIKINDLKFASVPGELFSSLIKSEDIIYICYANGYYRYIADKPSYEKMYYEALAAILKCGEGEKLINSIEEEF